MEEEEGKKKEGVSVKEIEGYAQRHRFEIFFCILFILASLFTLVFWGPILSVLLCGLGGIISVFFTPHIEKFSHMMAGKLAGQSGTTQLIIGIIALIIAIFLAPLMFLLFGLHAGKSLIGTAKSGAPHQ